LNQDSEKNEGGNLCHLRIYFDNSKLYSENPSRQAFYRKVFDVVGNWWGQALWVRDSPAETKSQIERYARYDSDYTFNLPEGKTLLDYDLFVKVSWGNDQGSV